MDPNEAIRIIVDGGAVEAQWALEGLQGWTGDISHASLEAAIQRCEQPDRRRMLQSLIGVHQRPSVV